MNENQVLSQIPSHQPEIVQPPPTIPQSETPNPPSEENTLSSVDAIVRGALRVEMDCMLSSYAIATRISAKLRQRHLKTKYQESFMMLLKRKRITCPMMMQYTRKILGT